MKTYRVQYHQQRPENLPDDLKRKWKMIEADTHSQAALVGLHCMIKGLVRFGIFGVRAIVTDAEIPFRADGMPGGLVHCFDLTWGK